MELQKINDSLTILTGQKPFKVASWATHNGGIQQNVNAIFNKTIDASLWNKTPGEIESIVKSQLNFAGINFERSVGLYTAVSQKYSGNFFMENADTGMVVKCFATAGIDNGSLCSPFDSAEYDEELVGMDETPHTINIICWVNRHLTDGAMLEALNQISHAKMAVLIERGSISKKSGSQALCTGTDCSAICIPHKRDADSSKTLHWAGPLTVLGGLIAHSTYHSIKTALSFKDRWREENGLPPL